MYKHPFCDENCRDNWREDRRAGLIYGSMCMPDKRIVSWFDGCAETGRCAYCGDRLRGRHGRKTRRSAWHHVWRQLSHNAARENKQVYLHIGWENCPYHVF